MVVKVLTMETFRKRLTDKKGVSNLIAAVLLIAATITISLVFTDWGKTMIKDITQETTNKSKTLTPCIINSQISIQDLKIDRSSNLIEAIVGNSAFSDSSVTLRSMVAYDDDGNYCELNSTNYYLEKGSITIVKNISCSIFSEDCADFNILRVTTDCATTAEFSSNESEKIMCIN